MPDIWSLISVGLTALFLTSESGHKFGYVDKQGNEVIPAKYLQAWPFQNGFARCYGVNPETGKDDWTTLVFIDKSGHEYKTKVTPQEGDPNKPNTFLIEGREIREDRSQTKVIEKNGIKFVRGPYGIKIIAPGEKKPIDANSCGWKGINPSSGNQWFLMDGKAFEFTGAIGKSSVPGLEPIPMPELISDWYGIKTKMNEKYDYFGELSDGLVAARLRTSKRWHYLKPDGQVAIELPENVCSTEPFSEGLAAVAIDGGPWKDIGGHSNISPLKGSTFGFIDKTGKFVIPPKFPCPAKDWHSKFKDGLALATAEKNASIALGYINTKGDFVVPPKYLRLDEFSEGLATFDAGPVGFNPYQWQKTHYKDVCQFLRQYNIFSMNKAEVKSLLGEPSKDAKFPDADAYLLSSGCLGSTWITIRYDSDDRVIGYTEPPYFGVWQDHTTNQVQPSDWIVSDQKPDVEEGFAEFFRRAKKVKLFPPIVKPKSYRTAKEVYRSAFYSPIGQLSFDAEVWKKFPEKRRSMLFSLMHRGLYKKNVAFIEQMLGPPDRIDNNWKQNLRYYSLKLPDYDVAEVCFNYARDELYAVLIHIKDESGIAFTHQTEWHTTNPSIENVALDINKSYALVGMPIECAHLLGFRTREVASHMGPGSPAVEILATPDKKKVEKLRVNFGAAKLSGYGVGKEECSNWEDTNFYLDEKFVFVPNYDIQASEQESYFVLPGLPFTKDSWKENLDMRYRQLFDLTHKHQLIGKSRDEIRVLLGQPDENPPLDENDSRTNDCDSYRVRKGDGRHGDLFQVAYTDNRAIAFRVANALSTQVQNPKIWEKAGGLYVDTRATKKLIAPMMTKLVKWKRNAAGEWDVVP